MLGIEIGLDFDGGSEWLKVKGAPVTKLSMKIPS